MTLGKQSRILELTASVAALAGASTALARTRLRLQPLATTFLLSRERFQADTYAVWQIFQNWLHLTARRNGRFSVRMLLAKALVRLILLGSRPRSLTASTARVV
jgi:hypothetical protein